MKSLSIGLCLLCTALAVFLIAAVELDRSTGKLHRNPPPPLASSSPVDPCSVNNGWHIPVDIEDEYSDEGCARFAWDTFIAVNWPLLGNGATGEPNQELSICDAGGE